MFSTFPFSFVNPKNTLLLSFAVSLSSTISSIFPSSATSFITPLCRFWSGSRYILVVIYPFLVYSSFSLFTNVLKSSIFISVFLYSFIILFIFLGFTSGFICPVGVFSIIVFIINLGSPLVSVFSSGSFISSCKSINLSPSKNSL